MSESNIRYTDAEALEFHSRGRPGKLEIIASKPMATQRDLSLAYSPGVAVPVRTIAEDPGCAYDFTAKGNLVAVISNGTAILGLGNLGALASKPVMEGKAVLFKRFADVDAIDIEVKTEDAQRFIDAVELLEPSFGGINLEDIAAPDCFIIEQTLRERMNIPVFHDDQHGTAIITAAGLINACLLTNRKLSDIQVVVNGAGAAAIACTELIKAMGVRGDHVLMCDRKGVISKDRTDLDQWKSAHAVETDKKNLAEALEGADVFLGLSAAGALKPEMVKTMAKEPIIFAMANPDPEIWPPDAMDARPDAIIATGRSDFPNQVNNVLGFPFIFRGALDVRATAINDAMKIAAAEALAELAREPVPEEVAAAYGGRAHSFGRDYIIPAPFDPRLMEVVAAAVAEAAVRSGVAQKPIANMDAYRQELRGRLNPTVSVMSLAYENARQNPKRVLFAEGEEPNVLRAAIAFKEAGYGTPVLVGREEVYDRLKELGVDNPKEFEVLNSRNSPLVGRAVDYIYAKHQRHGYAAPRGRARRQPGPQLFRGGDARARRGRCDDHRHYASLQPVAPAGQAGDRGRARRDSVRSDGDRRTQPHRAGRRYRRDRAADCRAICGHRAPLLVLRAADGPRAAGRVHQLHHLRQPARRPRRSAARSGLHPRRVQGRLRI